MCLALVIKLAWQKEKIILAWKCYDLGFGIEKFRIEMLECFLY